MGDQLAVEFGSARAKATYRVRSTDDYLAFELLAVEGDADRPDRVPAAERPPLAAGWGSG